MKKCIKADDLLGRFYEVTTVQGRTFLFKADHLFGETQTILRGETEEQERKIIRLSQIASVKREGVEYTVQEDRGCYGLDDWIRDAEDRDTKFGTKIASEIRERLDRGKA